jgi:hypothetical protein
MRRFRTRSGFAIAILAVALFIASRPNAEAGAKRIPVPRDCRKSGPVYCGCLWVVSSNGHRSWNTPTEITELGCATPYLDSYGIPYYRDEPSPAN